MQETLEQRIARRIREARSRTGTTQEYLSVALAQAGVVLHPTAITRIERGQRAVSAVELFAIASAFDSTIDEFLTPTAAAEIDELAEALAKDWWKLQAALRDLAVRRARMLDMLDAARDAELDITSQDAVSRAREVYEESTVSTALAAAGAEGFRG